MDVETKGYPMIYLQPDWNQSLWHNKGSAWITCKTGNTSVRGLIKHLGDEKFEVSEDFCVNDITRNSITVTCPPYRCKAKFYPPACEYPQHHQGNVTSIDISPGGNLGASGGTDSIISLWTTDTGFVRRELRGHYNDVTSCKFFPSGLVLLSASADMQVKVWSVEDGSNPATFRGHTSTVTDTAIVGRGRNVISCGTDGTARLWDCGRSYCLDTLIKADGSINACAIDIAQTFVAVGARQIPANDREIDTEGKILALAMEKGHMQCIDIYSRDKICKMQGSSAFNCCTIQSGYKIFGGCEDGKVFQFDLRNPSLPTEIFCRSVYPITKLKCLSTNAILLGTGDGCCYKWITAGSNIEEGILSTTELSGSNCDAILDMVIANTCIYTSCKDGRIRKYSPVVN